MRAEHVGIKRFVCNATCRNDWDRVFTIAEEHPNIYPCLGLHPWFLDAQHNVDEIGSALEELRRRLDLARRNGLPFVGLGEIGLDRSLRHRDDPLQENIFQKQLDMAAEYRLPAMIHAVHAVDRVIRFLSRSGLALFLMHGFRGSPEQGKALAELGGYFSFSVKVLQLRKPGFLRLLHALPSERLLLESDAPSNPPAENEGGIIEADDAHSIYLQRLPNGRLRNEPVVLVQAIPLLAEVLRISEDKAAQLVADNENRFFRLWTT